MTVKEKINKIRVVISKNTQIELGLILTLVGLIAFPIYKAIAKIENHETRITESEKYHEKINQIHEDVGYIKRFIEEQNK